MKPKIFVCRRLPEGAMRALEAEFDVQCNPHDRVLTRQELLAGVAGKDGVVSLLTDRIDGEVLDAAGPRLKIMANYAVGYNNIDVAACTARKVAVTNTPGVLTDTTADLTMALLLATARRLCESDVYARAGKYEGWAPLLFLGTDVHHKTLGLMGFGRVGYAVAQRAAGFDMKILYHDAHARPPELEQKVGATCVDKQTLLRESDFISMHVPLTPETRHLLSTADFAMMKPTAYVINTARGEVIDEAALAEAVKSGQIAGAGLDVFEDEPVIHPDLVANPSVVLLPHIGSASIETRTAMGMLDYDNLKACLIEGKVPPSCLNPEVFD
ncbi:MAG: D-glycerate dehydrogenase [Proteobacteria bacterium]|nr:D-glycerate dehydrogenase [Pseudomonadota bacterium]MBU2470474.1 D-glycerate dehydrogenase [Pseudomonadota bacterium]MBU2517539.1 D-glycerate dehydrogenase [Pseudomonadota bacterium]